MTAIVKNVFMKTTAFLLATSDSPSCYLAIIALSLLEALHREVHTRDRSARRDLILPAGLLPISLGAAWTCPPSCPGAGTCSTSCQQFWRSRKRLRDAGHEGGLVPGAPTEMREKVLLAGLGLFFQIGKRIFLKGLVTPRDHGFFLSKNHVIEEILNVFLYHYLLF